MKRTMVLGLVCLVTVACDKQPTKADPASEPAAPVASAEPAPPPAPAMPTAWSGKYVSKVGAVNPPANARNKIWEKDPGTDAVGEGTLEVSLDDKRVTGTLTGPLGECHLSGELDGDNLRANLVPNDPNADSAMTGFLVLTRDGDVFKGELRASDREGRIVREAKVDLAPKK